VAFANAEVRFPLLRRLDLGVLPIALPPIDALVFYDVGIAWTGQSRDGSPTQRVSWSRPDNYDLTRQRYPRRSYGYGVRFNLFGFAILRWDYAFPLDGPSRKPFGSWFFGPSF
jgi:outer membrane protein assembly factor BamA